MLKEFCIFFSPSQDLSTNLFPNTAILMHWPRNSLEAESREKLGRLGVWTLLPSPHLLTASQLYCQYNSVTFQTYEAVGNILGLNHSTFHTFILQTSLNLNDFLKYEQIRHNIWVNIAVDFLECHR